MDTRDFPIDVVLSALTLQMLCPKFSDLHDCIEFVVGHAVWTHELADRALAAKLAALIVAQHPALEGVAVPVSDDKSLRGEAYLTFIRPWLAQMADTHGAEITLRKGTAEREADPVSTLAQMVGGGAR